MQIAAIDQGTSSTRALVLRDDGEARIVQSLPHRQFFPETDWVEQDPLELLRNVRTCIQAAGGVDALGLANQGESCLAWDAVTGEPLSPVIVWQDNRTRATVARMRRDGLEGVTRERAGLPLRPYFSASKLRWLTTTLPAVKAAEKRGRLRLGTTDAFLLDRLTGEFVTDLSTASRTSLLNISTFEWDPVLCSLFEVPLESLPRIRPTVGHFGAVEKTPITASIVDQQAALFGHGCRQRGDVKITFGTGAFLLALTGGPLYANTEGLLPTVAWQIEQEPTFALDGGVLHAGSAVSWLRRLGLAAELEGLDASELVPAIARDLAFVPALSGLGCPHWDSSAASAWIGMTGATTARDLYQSVLEGVALRTVEVIEAADRCMGLTSGVSIDGGMTRNRYFAQFLADASGREILAHADEELTALGCAELAGMGAGVAPAGIRKAPLRYSPKSREGAVWRERFQSAVARSKAWRTRDD